MGVGEWISQNWFNLLSSVGIIGGLWFTAVSLHAQAKTGRVANLLTVIHNHRELWTDFYRSPQLSRVMDASADLGTQPVTREEERFVKLVIQHMNGVFQAMQNGLLIKPEGMRRDVSSFLSLPIPKAVWELVRVLQNDDFVAFVESCRNWK
jgi:hypothetical protein